ncbi:MAG: hypothetical protein FRX48_00333 [Lasallia pustulata]|uniref:Uncharacterized protein n=1 Tax=Lasallia pustulata TaxID=136370 RepID=A0A5M8Q2M0_9LECA|nr:MAG: hypothetical protein FRX48_00333 [Lasallia pustulata]
MSHNLRPPREPAWTGGASRQVNDEQWGGGAHQSNTIPRHQRKRWDPYNRKPGRAWHQDWLKNAPLRPHNMSGRINFDYGSQDRNPQPHQQHLSNGRSPPRISPLASPDQVVRRIGPLPPDHPLKVEMEELKQTRKRRQYYWVGLIEDLGEDEWENPANYDRQRWEEENALADQKFEDLAGRIKLAEMGIIDHSIQLEASQLGSNDKNHKAETNNERKKARNARRQRTLKRACGQRAEFQAHLHQRSERQNINVSKFQHSSLTSKSPRGMVVWTGDRKMEAIQKWMDGMGMKRTPTRDEADGCLVADDDSIMNDETFCASGNLPSDDSYGRLMNDSPLRFLEQAGVAKDDVGDEAVRTKKTVSKAAELRFEPLWTAEENAIFEEAEVSREVHRMELARLMTSENERCELLDPPKAATLAQDEHRSAKTMAIASFPMTEGTAMDIAGARAEAQGHDPRTVMANCAWHTALARDGGSVMDALLIQLGTSQLSLQDLALGATRSLERPSLSSVMTNEGKHSEITPAAGSKTLAPAATRDCQTPKLSINVAQERDQLELNAEERSCESGLAESQILAEFEQCLAGTSKEEQPKASTVDDLRSLALGVTQGAGESEGREQIEALTLEDLRVLALAAMDGLEEVEQSPVFESPEEQPAALTVLDRQARALAAANGLEVPEPSLTLASDRVQRHVEAVNSASTVTSADKDQEGTKVIAKHKMGGFREMPVAVDFVDIDEVPVEKLDMQDVPDSQSEVGGQILGDCDDMMRSNRPVDTLRSPLELEAASRNDGHALKSSSAAARLRAARGLFDRYSETPGDKMAEETQVHHIRGVRPETYPATAAPGASSVIKAPPKISTAGKVRSPLDLAQGVPGKEEDRLELNFC